MRLVTQLYVMHTRKGDDMISRIYSILIVIVLFPATLMAEAYNYPWKEGRSFEINRVYDLKNYYSPGELIEVTFSGRSHSSRVQPIPDNGFLVQAYIFDTDSRKTISGVNGFYDDYKQKWTVRINAPMDINGEYRLSISLYCQDGALCDEEFGRASQTVEEYSIKVLQ